MSLGAGSSSSCWIPFVADCPTQFYCLNPITYLTHPCEYAVRTGQNTSLYGSMQTWSPRASTAQNRTDCSRNRCFEEKEAGARFCRLWVTRHLDSCKSEQYDLILPVLKGVPLSLPSKGILSQRLILLIGLNFTFQWILACDGAGSGGGLCNKSAWWDEELAFRLLLI